MTVMSVVLILVLIAFMGLYNTRDVHCHSNTVAVAGSEVTMKCQTSSGNCNGVEWKKRNAHTEMRISSDNRILLDGYRDRYSVDGSSGCNLLIKNVSLTDATRFICEYIKESNTVTESSLLIVLESLLKCSAKVNASSAEEIAAEGDEVKFTCEVRFISTEGNASMTWKNLDNGSVSEEPNTDGILSHSVVARRPEIPSFECITTFHPPKNIAGLASNIPTGPPCTTTRDITLHYQVTTVTLTPSSGYSFGSEITCSADGYPPPSYKWQIADANGMNETWRDIETGKAFKPLMTAEYNGTIFRCVANNSIRGRLFIAFSQTFQVNDKPRDSGQNSDNGDIPIAIIASAAAAGVVALLILIVVICICRVRRRETKNKPGNDKSSGGDQIPLKSAPLANGSIHPQMTTIPIASIQPQPRGEAVKRPQIAPPEPKNHKEVPKKKRPDPPPQREEVLYADLAMEQGPKRRVQESSMNDPHAVYADVQLA